MNNKILKPLDLKNQTVFSSIRRVLYFAAAFCILVIAMSAIYSFTSSKKLYSISNDNSNPGLEFSITSSKNWDEYSELAVGAQYDCVFINHNSTSLLNWVCTISLPEDYLLDSSWSGVFIPEGNTLTVTPLDYNFDCPKNKPVTFGFILHSKELIEDFSYTFSYYEDKSIESLLAFRIAVVVLIFITLVLITQSLNDIRYVRLMTLLDQTFDTIVNVVDTFDEYTYNHSRNVAYYSMEIARKMHMSHKEIVFIYYTGLVHDVGKISIMRSMLNKKEKFTEEERELMKQHTVAGGEILKDYTVIPQIQDGALYHHERWDGEGYPKGLKGTEIPLYARIICVADCFDAMTTQRSYWTPASIESAVEEIKKCSGTQFDPQIVPYLLELVEEGVAPVKINS